MLRSFKQFFFLLVLGGLIFLLVLIINNNESDDIDVIIKPPIVYQPLEVADKWLFEASDVDYDLLLKIRNPNTAYGSGDVRYRVTLLRGDGQSVGYKDAALYILPGQTKYEIISFRSNEKVVDTEVFFRDTQWKAAEPLITRGMSALKQSNVRFVKSGSSLYYASLVGLVSNTSDYNFSRIDVSVILKGLDGLPIAAARTFQNNVRAGSQRDFQVFWFKPFLAGVGDAIIQPTTNLFDTNNFLRDPNQPSDLQ